MSRTIDERVVSMQFDNQDFERNVSTSMGTLDKLKTALNLKGAEQGLENVGAAANRLDMNPLAKGVETVKARFSALQVMAVTALANITNSAVNAGKKIISALTIDPIKAGFSEYETQINAVQTILANTSSKGTTLNDVNSALDTLNTYADKTIYNFTEMTRNIGTFTAAGVDLDTSVNAIQGIANLAAVSGSTSQQASTAMYQLSQALSSGTVKLMDWNSVVNAGMGGQVFQDALKETARVHGVAIDDMITSEGSFRETLSKGWLTSDILTETLSKFTMSTEGLTEAQIEQNREMLKAKGYTDAQITEIFKLGDTATNAATKVKTLTQLFDTLKEAAQSGWTQSWEIIVGDFEEAKKLFTEISDSIGAMLQESADSRNKMLQGWKDLGGRDLMIDSLRNAFEGLTSILGTLKTAWNEVFHPGKSQDDIIQIRTERLYKITEAIHKFSEKLKFSDGTLAKLKSTFKGVFAILEIGKNFLKAVADGVFKIIGNFTGLGEGVLGVTSSLGDWLVKVKDSVIESNIFAKAIEMIVKVITFAVDKIKDFKNALSEKIKSQGFETFFNVLKALWGMIVKVGSVIRDVLVKAVGALGKAFQNGDIKSLIDLFSSGVFAAILLGIKKFVDSFGDSLGGLSGIGDSIKGILDSVSGSLEAWQQNLKAKTLKKIAIAIAILAASLLVLSMINPERLDTALSAITILFLELIGALAIFNKMKIGNIKSSIATMIGISVAILVLSVALKTLSGLDMAEIGRGLLGVLGLMAIMVGGMLLLSRYGGKKAIKGALQMVIIAAAMQIFASVCKKFGAMDVGDIFKAEVAIAGILAIAAGFALLAGMSKKMLKSSVALILIGAAMHIFADVCEKFATMEWETLGKAGSAMAGILALAAGFALLAGMSKKMLKSSICLILIGAAMEIFADVCDKFGSMEWEELGKSGAAIAGILVLAAGFTLLSGMSKKMLKSVVCLTIMAAAMEIFADVCDKFGSMEWESLAKAGVAIAVIMLLVVGFAFIGRTSGGLMSAAASLVVMAVALNLLVPVMKSLGDLSWEQIGKGLLTIAGAFAVLGIAGYLLEPVVPVILGLAGALALIGLACLAAGIGVSILATGIMTLATLTSAAAVSIVASLAIIILGLIALVGDIIVGICTALINSIKIISETIIVLVVALCDVLIQCIPTIVETCWVLVSSILSALIDHGPEIAMKLLKLLIILIEILTTMLPELVGALVKLIISLLDAIAEHIPELVSAGIRLVGAIIQGIADALGPIIQECIVPIISALGDAMAGILEAIGPYMPEIAQSFTTLAQIISDTITEIVEDLAPFMPNIQEMVEAVSEAVVAICEAFIALVQELSPIIQSIVDLVEQLGDSISQIIESVTNLLSECGEVIAEVLGGISETIDTVFTGVSEVITSIGDSISGVLDSIAGIFESIGEAALNAGTGFEKMSDGIKTITELSLTDMAISLGAVATGLGGIASHAGGLSSAGDGLKKIVDNIQAPTAMFHEMNIAISSILVQLSLFGPAVSNAISSITNIAPAIAPAMTSMVAVVEIASMRIIAAMAAMMARVILTIGAQTGNMVLAFTRIFNISASAITALIPRFVMAATLITTALAMSLVAGSNKIKMALSIAMKTCVDYVEDQYDDFYSAGASLAEGMADGIADNQYLVEEKAKAMAEAAAQAVKEALDINTPSRVLTKIGTSVPEGFAKGVSMLKGLVAKSAISMSDVAVSATKYAIGGTRSSIRPVINASSARIEGLKIGPSINSAMNTQVTSMSRVMLNAQMDIDESNRNVVSAINGLREDLSSLYNGDDQEIGLYVDGKKLASSLAKPMNRELNILSKRGAY